MIALRVPVLRALQGEEEAPELTAEEYNCLVELVSEQEHVLT